MGFKLERKKTKISPYILIDEDKSYIRIEGESYLEDILMFFREINEWLERYLASDFTELTFDCEMYFFNSSTTKQLYNMFSRIDENAIGKRVVINWIVPDKNDEIMISCGEDFRDIFENCEFNIIIAN